MAALTLDELIDRLTLYHPGNARLSIAGPIDADSTLDTMVDHFDAIPAGEPVGDRAQPGPGAPGLHVLPVPPPSTAVAIGRITLAYPAPAADDPAFLAFPVAAGRLFRQGQHAGFVTSFAPLDDPAHLLIGGPLPTGADPPVAAGRLHDAVVSVLAAELGPDELATTARQFGPILGLPGTGPADSYGTAFRAARAPAVGLDPDAVATALTSLTPGDFTSVATMLSDHPVTGGAVVVEANP